MKKKLFLLFGSLTMVLSAIVIMSFSNSQKTIEKKNKTAEAKISATKSDTTVSGTAKFSETKSGTVNLQLSISIPALADHQVAVHIHEHGDCGDAGKNTHGHWNPTNKKHGKW